MMKLYYKPFCPFCIPVVSFANEKGIPLDLRDVSESESVLAELIARGGKSQVPYLVDDEAGIEMYESADIIAYLNKQHVD